MRLLMVSMLVIAAFACLVPVVQAQDGPSDFELSNAEHSVKKFEKKVARMKGKPFRLGWQEKAAMKRVKALVEKYPDHPKVKELFERTRKAIAASKGETFEITPEMLAYRNQEKVLVESIAELTKPAWEEYLAKFKASSRLLEDPFPAPDPDKPGVNEKMLYRKVILDDFEYPAKEFTNSGHQYVMVGSPTRGIYFVHLSNRKWLGAYEALKRYKRQVTDELPRKWTILGHISGSEVLVPRSGQKGPADIARFGWIVEPEAIYVEDMVFARYSRGHELGGRFIGELKLPELQAPFLTYTEVPDDVEPRQLVEIFVSAIKERNYDLYLDCIDPRRQRTEKALHRLKYLWDNMQRSLANYYVHVEPTSVGEIEVIQGSGGGNDTSSEEDFFTGGGADDEADKSPSKDLVESVRVEVKRYTEAGKMFQSPSTVELRRYRGGRWYVAGGFPF